MNITELNRFFESVLTESLLSYWLPRCEDTQYGGYLNCFDNMGETLVSHDKYTWSQGRFVWIFSRLFSTSVPIFSEEERKEFLRLAAQGAQFLMQHCLIAKDDWRCVFLLERDGRPKQITADSPLDASIYADCFAILGLGMYAYASEDVQAYQFAKALYLSATERLKTGVFNTLPYPLSSAYRAHGIPMIFNNTARELYRAAQFFDPAFGAALQEDMRQFSADILDNFVDENDVLREIITAENEFFPEVLGEHQNPGHVLEDIWFHLDVAALCDMPEIKPILFRIAKKTLEHGWDEQDGGLLHFSGLTGGEPTGSLETVADEPMTKQLSGWSDKLWWVHSEALYTALRCYVESKDPAFLAWFYTIKEYTFATFPHPDKEVGEWIQIRTRDGSPQEKIVALPVKDPFHIIRNVILILELLEERDTQT